MEDPSLFREQLHTAVTEAQREQERQLRIGQRLDELMGADIMMRQHVVECIDEIENAAMEAARRGEDTATISYLHRDSEEHAESVRACLAIAREYFGDHLPINVRTNDSPGRRSAHAYYISGNYYTSVTINFGSREVEVSAADPNGWTHERV